MLLGACSSLVENELEVINDSQTSIKFLFNGESHPIESGAVKTMKSVADGTPDYYVAYSLPIGIDSSLIIEKPELQFYDNDTKNTLLLTSFVKSIEIDGVPTSVYYLNLGVTTNKNKYNPVN